ncbi:MAG: MFS transporter [Nocardioides sp.]
MTEGPRSQPRAAGQPAEPPDPRRWRILSVALVVGFMSLLDVTIVNVALPSIQQGLGASPATIQWVVSGYALTFRLTLVTGGRLGDALGRRRMMLIGLTGFIAASRRPVGLAPTAGSPWPPGWSRAPRRGCSPPELRPHPAAVPRGRARAFGAFGFTVSVSSAVGPILGGLIIAAFGPDHGWRYIFLVNIPIGLVAMYFIARLVPGRPTDAEAGTARDLDLVGALLLGLTVLALLYPLVGVIGESRWVLGLVALAPRWSGPSSRGSGASSAVAGRPCSTWACYAAPRLRPRAGRGHDLLHRLHRGLPRLLGLPARAARPLGAARRACSSRRSRRARRSRPRRPAAWCR